MVDVPIPIKECKKPLCFSLILYFFNKVLLRIKMDGLYIAYFVTFPKIGNIGAIKLFIIVPRLPLTP